MGLVIPNRENVYHSTGSREGLTSPLLGNPVGIGSNAGRVFSFLAHHISEKAFSKKLDGPGRLGAFFEGEIPGSVRLFLMLKGKRIRAD